MEQQASKTYTLCMKVINASDVDLAFSRTYLFSCTHKLKVEQTITGGFVVKTLNNTNLGTLSDQADIDVVRKAYNQKKDELTQRALSNFKYMS